MKPYIAALRAAAETIDIPGTPRTLRLDDMEIRDHDVRLVWSFPDPHTFEGEPLPHARRLTGMVEVRITQGSPDEVAQSWWAEAQLAAARKYTLHVDADWSPGEPYVPRVWTADEAWRALLSHLEGYRGDVRVEDGEIRLLQGTEKTVFRIDPAAWAVFLNAVEGPEEDFDSDVVPVATPLADGLPLWAADELREAAGAWGPVIGLVDGELVGLETDD